LDFRLIRPSHLGEACHPRLQSEVQNPFFASFGFLP
jgi:hypothetical protein